MWPQWMNMLNWWQWLILAAMPPAIIALYFLKLKRRPMEVPSTYLWQRSIEDLRVNTVWQRLRHSLLLFLQLLLVALIMLAVLRPGWQGAKLTGDRFIFLVDNSASMQATDQPSNRLEEAKRRAGDLIDGMKSGDVAMVVSFTDTARVEQMFTDSRRALRSALAAIRPTPRRTSLAEALKVASGLANPGRQAYENRDIQVAEALPATVFILSDGNFEKISGFPLGNLHPIYTPLGQAESSNVGIVAFSVRRHETRPELLQTFGRLENFSDKDLSVDIELWLDGKLINADRVNLSAGAVEGVAFDLSTIDSGVLKLRITNKDDLALDNEAYAVVNPPRRARALLVTSGNESLQYALNTESARQLADLTVESPDFLDKPAYQQQADAGALDLVIYDRCRPKTMPQASTLFIGSVPPAKGWQVQPRVSMPQIIDTDPAHPLMQWINLGDVTLADGAPLTVPPGGRVLIDSHAGPMFAIAPRQRFEDAALGFVLVDQVTKDGKLESYVGTNWPIRASFPLFVLNVLEYLGGGRTLVEGETVQPGQPVALENPAPGKRVQVRTPSGDLVEAGQESGGKVNFTGTDRLGVYQVLAGGKPVRQFCVNLFDGRESNIRPQAKLDIGPVRVAAQASGWSPARREAWKWILLVGLGVLLLEWYIYNRRVSL
jgi:hypothetical protein